MIIEDLDVRADLWAGALCAPRRPSVVGAGARLAWIKALDAPFEYSTPEELSAVIETCQRCPLSLQCAAEAANTGAEYGVWAGEVHEPELDDEVLGAGASA